MHKLIAPALLEPWQLIDKYLFRNINSPHVLTLWNSETAPKKLVDSGAKTFPHGMHHNLLYYHDYRPRGGHWPRKGVWGCAAVMTPFFSGQSALPSLPIYHQYAVHVPLIFNFFREKCIFSLILANISALKTQIFPNFCSQDPSFFRENPLLWPYFWKPVWHTPTKKKKLSAPPPPGL